MKVSVIIPVYNTAEYLDICIESVINQSYKNIEIILVNDGSTDNSAQICEKWAEKDSRIVYISKENGGLSSARNAGIDVATGDCFCFVDSDDCVAPFYVEKFVQMMQETDAPLALCGYIVAEEFTRPENIPVPLVAYATEVIDQRDYFLRLFTDKEIVYVTAWNKLFDKKLFENTRFEEGKLHEDEGILLSIVKQCDKIAVCYQPLYFYTQRQGSIMKSQFKTGRLDVFPFYQERMDYFTEKGWHDLTFMTMKAYLLGCLSLYKQIDKDTPDGDMYKRHLMTMFKTMLSSAKKCPVKSKKFLLKMDYYAFFPNKFNPDDRSSLLFN